jgi:hypothetical protein
MKRWLEKSITGFFSDEKQDRLLRILDGLNKVTTAYNEGKSPAPDEHFYNEMFTEIFPKKPEIAMRLWHKMSVEQRFGFLKASSAVAMLYKQAWNKYPDFVPEKIARLIHAIVRF